MRVDELTSALREATAAQPHVDGRLDAVYERRSRRRRTTGGLAAVAALVVVAVTVGIGVRSSDDAVITDETGEVGVAVAGEWEPLPHPPLAPRVSTTMVWTGEEVLVIGGDTFLCPPGADCVGPTDPPLADGAAFDPKTRTWRPIADAPVGITWARTTTVGNDVYVLVPPDSSDPPAAGRLLRYSIGADSWTELPLPAGDGPVGWTLTAVGDDVVATYDSAENGRHVDRILDASTNEWSDIPPDPLGPSYDRRVVWVEPYLYLFAHDLVGYSAGGEPSVAQAARFDLGTQTWEELPPTESLGFGWFDPSVGSIVHGTEIVQPVLGGADGGEVNNWGREYPNGGIYDVSVPEWRPLPDAPDDDGIGLVGAIGRDRVWAGGGGGAGLLLDLMTDTWVTTPPLVTSDPMHERRNLIGSDQAIIAYGGERWGPDSADVLGDAWILTFDRP